VKVSHTLSAVSAAFDEPNLVADAGLVSVLRLAERARLPELTAERVRINSEGTSAGANPVAKVLSLVATMCAGANSIDDVDRLRHGAMPTLFEGVRAPSTLDTFLRSFTHGHVRQLHRVHRDFLANLTAHSPPLPGAQAVAFIDIDPTHRRVYGRAKQGAQVGRLKGQRTLHPCWPPYPPPGPPGHRRRASAQGQGRRCARRGRLRRRGPGHLGRSRMHGQTAGARGFQVLHRRGGGRRAGAHFSLTTGMNPSIAAAIGVIGEQAWTAIHYRRAFVVPDTGELIFDAEVAEIGYTAFTSRPQTGQVTARLIVRRLNSDVAQGQGELFTAWRYHPIFTDSPFELLQGELHHRQHTVVEQVIADGKAGPLAHLPWGKFQANPAWLTLWAIAHNLPRAAGSWPRSSMPRPPPRPSAPT
jgi:Transposase DDE domain group 1